MTLRLQISGQRFFINSLTVRRQTKLAQVNREEIAINLVRCNPALARYFSSNYSQSETAFNQNQNVFQSKLKQLSNQNEQYEKNQYLNGFKQQSKQTDQKPIRIENQDAQTDKRLQSLQKRRKNQKEEQIKQYYRELKQTSRYLSNTGFHKYFNRPIFQNYGRSNTNGTNDGIIYGNYLKSHNVNPHTGQNRPHDQETFYHALISASPNKLVGLNRLQIIDKDKNLFLSRFKQNFSSEKPLKKHQNNPDEIIIDNVRQHNRLNNLQRTKTSISPHSKSPLSHIQAEKSQRVKSPKINQRSPLKITSQYVNQKKFIQPVKPKELSVQERIVSPKIRQQPARDDEKNVFSINKNKLSLQKVEKVSKKGKCPVEKINQYQMDHVLSKQCNKKKSPNFQVVQTHPSKKKVENKDLQSENHQARAGNSCESKHLNNIKSKLKQKAQSDIDLNNRLISSARKATMYKNYSLNSDNAKLNPHNYNECCGAIYEG